MAKVLGISAFYHDSAAALTIDGEVVAAAQEERFTRKKHTADFPKHAISYCLQEAGLTIDELDAVAYYEKPLLKFERLLETYYAFAPKGLLSFLKAIPIWLKEKMFLKKQIYDGLQEVEGFDRRKLNLLFPEHHLSHASSAFYPSAFERSAILSIDGVGEWSTASIGIGDGRGIRFLKELHFPYSPGLLYSAFTYFLGFKVNSGEYKLMGLAPYGNANSDRVHDFISLIKQKLVHIKEDGSIWMDQTYFKYPYGLKMVDSSKWKALFGFGKRNPEESLEQHHCDLALACQMVLEEIMIKMAQEAQRITGADYLCLAGGVALNCVANGKLIEKGLFKGIFFQPAAGDAGAALGAALAAEHIYFKCERPQIGDRDLMKGTYLGPDFSSKEIVSMNKRVKASYQILEVEKMLEEVAGYLAEGKIIGWFQGRMEFGPRALGNRSILADPRRGDMQKKLNLKIKGREGFRPFAPAVLEEDKNEYFDLRDASPTMSVVTTVGADHMLSLPDNFETFTMAEKLYLARSDIQAVTHVDGSARVQTVSRKTNKLFYDLISAFKGKTGCGLLINTSFNVRGEPIVCTPFDAYRCFMSTDIDYLVINEFVYSKIEQPEWENKDPWLKKFELD